MVRRINPAWVVGWVVSVVAAGLVGFWGAFHVLSDRWALGAMEQPPPAAPCALLGPNRSASQLWDSMWSYSPGDDSLREELRFSREGDLARLEVIHDGMLDDEVSANRETYWLAWLPESGWSISSCESKQLR